MILRSLDCQTLEIPLARPFKTARRTVQTLRTVVVRATSDSGAIGWGAAPETVAVTGESAASIQAAIRGPLADAVRGEDLDDLHGRLDQLEAAMVGNTSATAAVEIALHDLWARDRGGPLIDLLGGRPVPLETNLTISLDEPEVMARRSAEAVAAGYRTLKIKLGRDLARDRSRLEAVRDAAGPDVGIRLDANQGWTAKGALELIEGLMDAGIRPELIEQPTPARDLDALKFVTDRSPVPIMADESAAGPEDVLQLVRTRAADQINVKLMKAGGIRRAWRAIDLARLAGMEVMIGCMLESSIGIAAALHLAAAHPGVTRVDLDAAAFLATDPVRTGATLAGPRLTIDPAPGLGIDGVDGYEPPSDPGPPSP